ncbi:Synembryn-A [Cytospora mali]|uniref:Synembryn-A n=1 Tax=Cytospora mali TaxID=578113 RepID=A0A194V2G6_CYTMA|nr:Synembryn-A [Valsa mali var. pyri (nom. inval.)]
MASVGAPWTGTLTAKLEAVTRLMERLTTDLEEKDLTTEQRDALLEELKVYGRDPRNADPIFTKDGIKTLTRHAFDTTATSTSHNALRCLANTMLIKPEARQTFVDLGYEAKACEQLKRDTWDDEFLCSRVIFLTTYGTNIDLAKLVNEYGLAKTIINKLAKHADLATGSGKARADPMQDMALADTLKLMFNVTHFYKDSVDSFTPAVPHIMTLLQKRDTAPSRPLDGVYSHLINALVNLKLDSEDVQAALYPEGEQQNSRAERLIVLLDLSMKAYSDNDLEQIVTPLVSVLRSMHESAPEAVRGFIRSKLLPTKEDREEVLGRAETLASRLLRNTTNAVAPQLRDAISHLLFEMSDKDASKFVENVGYGYASGFLFQNNIPVPESVVGDAGGDSSNSSKERPVNPITGQFLDQETGPDLPEMTEEEKEREAERLFVLFERLKKTGIIDVQNPVEQAMREGRFQDIKDEDRVEELD